MRLFLLFFLTTTALAQPNWPHWRGPQDTGCVEGGSFPVQWSQGSAGASPYLWTAPLPGKGCSTPIVWDKKIFLTAPTNGLDAALTFDASGRALWMTTLGSEKAGKHRNGSGCNASPAADGRGVFV